MFHRHHFIYAFRNISVETKWGRSILGIYNKFYFLEVS
jgi:hypothetical protein